MTEKEMVGWHHWLDGHEFELALSVGDGQEAWHAAFRGVTKSQSQLSDWTEYITSKDMFGAEGIVAIIMYNFYWSIIRKTTKSLCCIFEMNVIL